MPCTALRADLWRCSVAERSWSRCATCHGEAGVGRGSRAPRLAGSGFATSARNVAGRVLDGSGAMPSFARLANEEIAAIANYVATVINGGTALVAAANVEAMRP
ncbi:MAG: cytochrome c [Bauldia sp.]